MSDNHDAMATAVGTAILQKIRHQNRNWKQIFSSSITRVGDWDWPRPDFVCNDSSIKATYALEFKPPRQSKREYLTGLGQSIAYLYKHNYAGLIIPKTADDGFLIGKYIKDVLNLKEFNKLPLSLFEYDETSPESSVEIIRLINAKRDASSIHGPHIDIKTFWSWWRDMSNYEVYRLLELSDAYRDEKGDIYSNNVFPKFYELLNSGKTLQWDGTPRKKKGDSYQSEKQNYKIPLFQLGLWSQADGRLTLKGYKLLNLGKIYGPDGKEFIDYLTYILLIDGKHLELIREIYIFQKNNKGEIADKSVDYLLQLEKYLSDKGLIGARKPTAITTGAKHTYIRDEPKLWNKLGLLEKANSLEYFIPSRGYLFNWDRITEIIQEDYPSE